MDSYYFRKRLLVVLVAASVQIDIVAQTAWGAEEQKDLLLPFTHTFAEELRPTLEKKLLVSAADHGRMLRLYAGPNIGELAVSLHCDDTHANQCMVTLTEAKANLDFIFANHRDDKEPFAEVNKVAVVRKDVEIPKKIAAVFRNCVQAMLPRDDDHRVELPTIADNDRVEFWLTDSTVIRKGERGEHSGNRTKALIKIGDLLVQYCKVVEAKRPVILRAIENEAVLILGRE